MMEIAELQEKTSQTMDVEQVYSLIEDDMMKVNAQIEQRLQSDVVLINQLSNYIIHSGGKRLRPVLVLLSAGAANYQGNQHINLAAIVEFIHTATLLHDDVVDASETRRGNDTANSIWGNEAAVLVGDFLYSRAFQMMVDADSMYIMQILANATNTIAEGEVLQLLNCNDPSTTEARYLDVIRYKTAKLFEAAAQLGAVISHLPKPQEEAMARYGMHLGTAFQLVDDVLDYSSSTEEMGKNIGDDLAEGKPTLPLIRAMSVCSAEQKQLIRQAILEGGRNTIDEVTQIIHSTDAIDYTAQKARDESLIAIDTLNIIPDSKYKDALITLAEFSVSRTY